MHKLPSSQLSALPGTQPPMPLHESVNVHALPSLHTVPLSAGKNVHLPEAGVHTCLPQAPSVLSVQSIVVVRSTKHFCRHNAKCRCISRHLQRNRSQRRERTDNCRACPCRPRRRKNRWSYRHRHHCKRWCCCRVCSQSKDRKSQWCKGFVVAIGHRRFANAAITLIRRCASVVVTAHRAVLHRDHAAQACFGVAGVDRTIGIIDD